ncbi:hypothetical protein N0V85_003332 [Neurospora sp. IMI 360204]|nr:hypothetical protein N0V85_003332 [Neurospora sp. IMI 360204]
MRHRDRARGGGEQLVPGWEPAHIYKPVPRWERVLCGEPNRPLEYYQPNYRQLDKLGHYQDHMAIEWDPAWSSNTDAFKELTSGLVFPSLQRGYTWFIDYGLEPKHDNVAITDLNLKRAPKDSEEVLVFDDAHGGRYVEVYFYENDLNLHTGERVAGVCFDETLEEEKKRLRPRF